MPEADVLYSDVKFTKSKDKVNGKASPSEDTTYSEVKIATTTQPPADLTDPQQTQPGSNSRSGSASEKLTLFVLIVLLVAAAVALGYTTYQNMQTTENLRRLLSENELLKKNISEQRKCETTPVILQPNCWTDYECHKCEPGWELFGKSCYFFSTNESSWNNSRDGCRKQRGDLVKIDSREEQRFLDEKLRDKMEKGEDKFWIGLTDIEDEGTWLWVDRSPLNSSLAFWNGEEPDNWKDNDSKEEDCGRMGEKGEIKEDRTWFDRNCEEPHKYICEKMAEKGNPQCV